MENEVCNTCQGSGWVRPDKDLEFYEEGFGDIEPCPECREEEILPDPEQDPEPEQLDLRWQNYTE